MFVRAWEPPSGLGCLLEQWCRELGFALLYGSILIKLHRILSEFQSRKAHRVCLRDRDQIVYLLGLVLVVVGYMSAWTALVLDGFFANNQQQQQAGQSLAELFSGLLDTQLHYDGQAGALVHSNRCRKLTWDYVTQLSEYRAAPPPAYPAASTLD